MKNKLYALVIFVIFFGCMESLKKEKNQQDTNSGSMGVESFSVALDSSVLDHYERGVAVFEAESSILLAAYNRHTHAIDWFDVTNESIHHRTVLDKQGPNEITGQVNGLYVHTPDSIFLNDGVFVYMINKNGEVNHKIPNSFETEIGTAYLVNRLTSSLHYSPHKGSLIGEALIPGKPNVFFLEINLRGEIDYLHQAGVSDCYTEAGSQDHFLNVSFKGDSVIYNSSCSSDIFVYDTESKQTLVYDGKSSFSKNSISEIKKDDPDALWQHYIENPRFFQIVFSPVDNLYYRLHWAEADYHIDETTFRTPYDKPVVLTVFSEKFELVYEVILPENQYYVDFLIPTPQGVMLNANHPQRSNYEINEKELHMLRFYN